MPRVVMFEGKQQSFPDDATDAEISAALGAIPAGNAAQAPKAKTWTDRAVNALPAVGATVGGIVGGIGGTAFGVGFGGVPGAMGGSALGGGAGEAAKQLINRVRGADAPSTVSGAAADIGIEGLEDAAAAGVLGGAGKLAKLAAPAVAPVAAKTAELTSDVLESPLTNLITPRAAHAAKILDAFAQTLRGAPAAQKVAINAADYTVIQALKKIGVPEGEALQKVLNMKARAILKAVK